MPPNNIDWTESFLATMALLAIGYGVQAVLARFGVDFEAEEFVWGVLLLGTAVGILVSIGWLIAWAVGL